MSRSGEKHAQDYNLMWCILMALRVIYFPAVIYGDPVYLDIYLHYVHFDTSRNIYSPYAMAWLTNERLLLSLEYLFYV